MASSPPAEGEQHPLDPSAPLKGVVVCCTSIPPDQRAEIDKRVAELGGIHKYDLTPNATHLVVGDYDTPKYRHVARERPDVKAMDAAWIDAVSELWKKDEEIDFAGLETKYRLKPLERGGAGPAPSSRESQPPARQSLLICLTGFGDQRDEIARTITSHGGRHTGDLTRRCSHLIVSKPQGNKFTAAKSWDVHTVTLDWLHQSIARGMILEESKFDPLLPLEDQGVGAWVNKDPKRESLGKRPRSATAAQAPEEGARKLRKTASMKLSSQRNDIWGDILGRSTEADCSFAKGQSAAEPTVNAQRPGPTARQEDGGVLSACVFAIHGFDQTRRKVLAETIATLGGAVAPSLEEAASCPAPTEPFHRFLIVPQTSQPETHPRIPNDAVHVVTEFYIERCLHNKRFLHPSDHALGRPFPRFPIHGFSGLTICSAAFTGLDLSQVARGVGQLGAKFDEEFRRTTSLVVCKSLKAMRKEKLRYALEWAVPVVSANWLWECISTGFNVPVDGYVFPELRKQYATKEPTEPAERKQPDKPPQRKPQLREQRAAQEPTEPAEKKQPDKPPLWKLPGPAPTVPGPSTSRLPAGAGVDATAFDRDSPQKTAAKKPSRDAPQQDSTTSADFMTARTHAADTFSRDPDGPLHDLSSASLNKPPSLPTKHASGGPARTRSEPSARAAAADKAPAVSTRGRSAPPPDGSEAARRAAAERANREAEERVRRERAQAAERQALSFKLNSLLPTPPAATAAAAATAAITDPDARDSRAQARPRRRQVLGRAISNVSNGSSAASIDGRPAPEMLRGDGDGDDGEDPLPPPATQLEYRDPHVLECKAALVSKMMGGSGTVGGATDASQAAGGLVGVSGGRTLRKR